MDNFVHCHCHDSRSFFDGLNPCADLVERAAELGQPGIALTNHGNLYSAAQFFKACEKHGIKGIIGMEAYEAVPHQWDRERDKAIVKRKWDEGPRYFHLTIWVKDLQGWENLCALHSKSFGWNYKPGNQPLIDRASLEEHHEGLMIGLGCMASRTNVAMATGYEDPYEAAKWYPEVFGPENVYCELMGNLAEQQALIRPQRALAQRLGVAEVGTNDVHYVHREDGAEHAAHHSLVQARAYRRKDAAEKSKDKSDEGYGQWYGSDEFFLKTRADMLATPGIIASDLDRTLEILDKATFDFSAMQAPAPPVAPVPVLGEDPNFDTFLLTHT
jgi:DNA polymerase-3 subunit alpha